MRPSMLRICLAFALLATAPSSQAQPKPLADAQPEPVSSAHSMALKTEVEVGAALFYRACGLCHDDSEHMLNDNGPALFGVVGRRVGSVEGYAYSPALQTGNRKGHTWTEKRLDEFLAGPQHMYTGTDMPMMFNDPKVRQALIAYLKSLKSEN